MRFTQVAHDKRANARIARFFLANCSFALSLTKNERFAQKALNKIVFFVCVLKGFRKFKKKIDSLIPSLLKSNVCELLRLLMTKERL